MPSEIVRIDHETTKALSLEMDVLDRNVAGIRQNEILKRYPDVEAYTKEYFSTLRTTLCRRFNASDMIRDEYFLFLRAALTFPLIRNIVFFLLKKLSCIQVTFGGIK